jgi:hypothetical protein
MPCVLLSNGLLMKGDELDEQLEKIDREPSK